VQALIEGGKVALSSAPPSKDMSLDGIVIRLDLLMVLHPSIFGRYLLRMALHLSICGCYLFLVALHLLLLLLFLWT
jgi:hypothetical protein